MKGTQVFSDIEERASNPSLDQTMDTHHEKQQVLPLHKAKRAFISMEPSLEKGLASERSLREDYLRTVSNRRASRKINSVSFDRMY